MKAVVAAFNQEKALVGAFSVITNLRMELFEALEESDGESCGPGSEADPPAAGCQARFTRSFNWNLKRGLGEQAGCRVLGDGGGMGKINGWAGRGRGAAIPSPATGTLHTPAQGQRLQFRTFLQRSDSQFRDTCFYF